MPTACTSILHFSTCVEEGVAAGQCNNYFVNTEMINDFLTEAGLPVLIPCEPFQRHRLLILLIVVQQRSLVPLCAIQNVKRPPTPLWHPDSKMAYLPTNPGACRI